VRKEIHPKDIDHVSKAVTKGRKSVRDSHCIKENQRKEKEKDNLKRLLKGGGLTKNTRRGEK